MSFTRNRIARFHRWRKRNMSERAYITTISIVTGLFSGLAAVILKNTINFTHSLVDSLVSQEVHNYIYFALPLIGITLTVLVTSYLFLGQDVLYPFEVTQTFELADLPFYILLGVLAGFVSLYFTRMYLFFSDFFERLKKPVTRLLIGGTGLGVLVFLFPSLYGEGYEAINASLAGNTDYLFDNSLFFEYRDEIWAALILTAMVILFKIVATSLTFGAGGIGGIFAPTLFMGVNTGMLFAYVVNLFSVQKINLNNFALIGMAGLIAGVLHAPLTGIFLIADISGGYKLFVPLMITATVSYIFIRSFTPNSVYHIQLARRKELLTHDKDANVLQMLEVRELIEKDFEKLSPDATLRDLTTAISRNHRNLFPVVDDDGKMVGMVKMDDVRELIFKQELYDKIKIKDIMYMPEYSIDPDDSMEVAANNFETSGRYNLAVIDKNGKYEGFISRAKVFTRYRKQITDVSHV